MPKFKQRDFIIPVLAVGIVILVALSVASGIRSFRYFHTEFENTLRQHNSAILSNTDVWIASRGHLVENNALLLRNPDFTREMAVAYFAEIVYRYDFLFDVYVTYSHARPWYILAANNPGTVIFSPPYRSEAANGYVFSAARTICDYGTSMGIAALDVPFEVAAEYIRQTSEVLEDGFSFVLDYPGNVLVHNDPYFAPCENFARMVEGVMRYGIYRGDGGFYTGGVLETTGWYIITRVPDAPIFSDWLATFLGIAATILIAVLSLLGIRAVKSRIEAVNAMNEFFLETSPIMINIWDENHKLVSTSGQSFEMFGLSGQDYMDRFHELAPEFQPCGKPTSEEFSHGMKRAFDGERVKLEWMCQTLDGKPLPTEVTMIRFTRRGKPLVAAYVADLRQVKDALERERKLELQLHEQEMNERVHVAEEASKAKSRFLASMSHEIRTPITAVLGISEIELQKPNLPPHLEESFSIIHSSANMLLGIVNDVLDLSKIEAGKMELQLEEYEVAGMIGEVAGLHLKYLNSKKIAFLLNADENLPAYLFGDARRIEQILNNLLSNAFKYTENGSVELNWSCRPGEEGFIELVASVSDTGLGMTEEQLHILQHGEYTRFHENRIADGTGLGIPIVCNLLSMMDGKFEIESAVDKGTTVTVTIPQKLTEKTETIGAQTLRRLQQFEDVTRGKKFAFVPEPMPDGKVLIVDDVDANIYVAKGLLSFYDLNVEACSGGQDAIDKIALGEEYDIIFMDYMMPGLNGIETMHALRKRGYTRPIVALTANAIIGQEEEFIKSGFDGFLSKPIQTKHLNSVLTKHIKVKQPSEVIESFQDNAGVVNKLRTNFAQSHKNTFDELEHALDTGDTDAAHLLAHSIKGVAALIHEPALSDVAEQVEKALCNGKTPPPAHMNAFRDEMARVLEDIGEIKSPAIFAAQNSAKPLFDKLQPLIESQNIECLTLLDELKALPETAVLVKQIEDFDFRGALKTLEVLQGL